VPELPTVSEAFEADISPFIAAIRDARDSMLEAAAAAKVLQETIDSLHGTTLDINLETTGSAGAAGFEAMAQEAAAAGAAASAATPDIVALGKASGDAGNGAAAAAVGFRAFGFGMGLTRNAIHWIIAGSAEFLAVAVPAAIALGAGLMVASQGAQNVGSHMRALYDTMEAVGPVMGKTAGDVLGLGHALQTAQNQANPGVYTILGSVINDARTRFADFAGAGLQVVHMLDEFAARVTVDLQGSMGTQLHDLLSRMVTDLQQFGQVLGNLGHAVLNFAAAMPGLAAVLLTIVTYLSSLIEVASRGGVFFTFAMAMEEFFRWGGLALGILVRLTGQLGMMNSIAGGGGFIVRFGAALLTLVSTGGMAIAWAGRMIGMLGELIPVAGAAGAAMETFGTEVAVGAATMSPLLVSGIAAAVAAGVGLIIMLEHVKDATDNWVAATDKAVQGASDLNVYNTALQTMSQNADRLATAQGKLSQSATHVTQTQGVLSRYVQGGSGIMARQAQDVQDLTQQQSFLANTLVTVSRNAENLGQQFHISATAATYLANAAGVNLQQSMAKGSEAFKIAVQQIKNFETGIGAMGAPVGMVGADVQAMGIQTQLAATKIQQLNQAWDQWVQSVNNGLSTMAATETAIGQLGGSTYTLAGYSQRAMTSFTNFTQAIAQGQTAIDTLRTGMAEQVVTAGQFRTTIQGLVGQMAPFTRGNHAAVEALSQLAHQAGGPTTSNLKTLEHWAGVTGKTARDQFARGMENATTAMGQMAKIAQNLSATVNTDLNAMFAKAAIQASGLGTALTNLANAMANPNTSAATMHARLDTVITSMLRLHENIPTITAMLNGMGINISQAGVKALIASGHLDSLAASESRTGANAAGAAGSVSNLVNEIAGLHSKSVVITTVFQQLGQAGGTTFLQSRGHAAGTPRAQAGMALVGEHGPELVMFAGGERVLSNPDTTRFLANPGGPATPLAVAGGGQAITLHANIHVPVQVDGETVMTAMQPAVLKYNIRNGNAQAGTMAPPA
jgi:hypothetical protein